MDNKTNDLQTDVNDPLRLVRVRRMAASKLIPESVANRFAESNQVGASMASAEEISWVTKPSLSEKSKGLVDPDAVIKQSAPSAKSEMLPTLSHAIEKSDYSLEKADLAIRKLVLAEQSWAKMQPHAWHIYEKMAQPEIAAKLAELAYLHGTIDEFISVLVRLCESGKHFYFMMQKKIRDHLLPRLWSHGSKSVLQSILGQKLFRPYLIPIEHLFVFWQYYQNGSPDDAYQYFSRYRFDILQAAADHGSLFSVEQGTFYFIAGKLAYTCEDFKEARLLLSKLTSDDKDYQKALDLLVTFDPEIDAGEYDTYERQLSEASDWEERLRLLRRYLDACVQTLGLRHSQRAALNRILLEPTKWIPETPFAWGKLSDLLAEYCEVESILPNIFYTYKEHFSQFLEPLLEKSLWSPLLKLSSTDQVKKNYWRSLALVHEYVAVGPTGEQLLWEARALHAKAWLQLKCDDALSWKEVLTKTGKTVAKLDRLDEKQRDLMLAQLGVAGHQLDVDPENIEIYLDRLGYQLPHQGVVELFRNIADARDEAALEKRLIQTYASTRYYSNKDLARLWWLGRKLHEDDLALRAASILKARKALAPNVEQMWVLTGEMRREQAVKPMTSTHLLSYISDGLSEQQRQMIDCIFTIGPKIPELLALVCKDIMPRGRISPLGVSAFDKDIEKAVAQLSVPAMKAKGYLSRMEASSVIIPPFAAAMPENRWSQTFLALSDRLGINSWRWQMSLLGSRLEGVFSKAHRGLEQKHLPVKVGKWLRQLEPMQRKAWYELGGFAKRLGDESVAYDLGLAIARLATAMTSQHTLALESLAQMHVCLDMRWDLEKWILSDAYGKLRAELGTAYKLQIPKAVSEDPLG